MAPLELCDFLIKINHFIAADNVGYSLNRCVENPDPTIYQATTTILIESQGANVVSIEEIYGLDTRAQLYYETQFEILNSRPLAERVISKLALTGHAEFRPREKSKLFDFDWRSWLPLISATPDDTALDPAVTATKIYMANLQIEPMDNTQLVQTLHQASTGRLFFDDKQRGFSEAVRTVRTSIHLSNLDNPYQTILVTSAVEREGKTTTAINLACAFGKMKKLLLLYDQA